MKKIIAFLVAFALAFGCLPVIGVSAAEMPEMNEYGFVDCGEAKIEYGIYGAENSRALLLLPPNGGDMHALDGSVLPGLAEHFKVITVSPRGTGKSDWVEGGMTFEAMADDLADILDYLDIDKVDIFGFSDGGNLGFVFTLKYQERVNSLAVMGSNINTWGTNTFDQIQITYQWIVLCVEAWLTGDPETARRRDIKGMMVGQPSLTFKDIAQIKVPVLNIYGEHDMIQRWHSKKITASIEGAQELMVIGGGHSSCFDYTDTVIMPALLDFYGVEESESPHAPQTTEEIVELYNQATADAVNNQAGFSKTVDTELRDLEMGAIGKIDMVRDVVGGFFSEGRETLSVQNGEENDELIESTLSASDVTAASCKLSDDGKYYELEIAVKNEVDPDKANSALGSYTNEFKDAQEISAALQGEEAEAESITLNVKTAVIKAKIAVEDNSIDSIDYVIEIDAELENLKYVVIVKTVTGTIYTQVNYKDFVY